MPKLFRCPSDDSGGEGETSYVMITGKGTVGGMPGSPGTRLGEFTDGLAQTILVAEVHGLKIPWTEPRDITLDELLVQVGSGARIAHLLSFNVGLADGSVHTLFTQVDPETLRALATINGRLPVTNDQK
jgi:hypothetical protein